MQCSDEEAEKRWPVGGGACGGGPEAGGKEREGKERFDLSLSSVSTSSSTSVPQVEEAMGVGGHVAGRGGVAGGAQEVPPVERIAVFVGLTPEQVAAQIEV